MADTVLSIEQVAHMLGVSERTIRRMIKDKRLKGFRVGQRQWRVEQADLDAYIEEQKRRVQES